MNRLYVTDLDHTFLRSDLSISGFAKKIWNEKRQEAFLSIATARSFYSAQLFLKDLEINAPMILLDGSLIVTPQKKIIDVKFLNRAAADELIAEAIKFDNLHPFVIGLKNSELDEAFFHPVQLTPMQIEVLKNYKSDKRLEEHANVKAMERTLKIVYMADEARLRPLTLHLKAHYGDLFEFKLSPENYTGGYFLTILHPLGDKAHALEKVSEYTGRPLEDVTVFGDSINDIGMFKLAGTSAAVKNALEEVKAVARIILPHTNDEDAVANYLKTTMK